MTSFFTIQGKNQDTGMKIASYAIPAQEYNSVTTSSAHVSEYTIIDLLVQL
jgi:hypothetical protein